MLLETKPAETLQQAHRLYWVPVLLLSSLLLKLTGFNWVPVLLVWHTLFPRSRATSSPSESVRSMPVAILQRAASITNALMCACLLGRKRKRKHQACKPKQRGSVRVYKRHRYDLAQQKKNKNKQAPAGVTSAEQ